MDIKEKDVREVLVRSRFSPQFKIVPMAIAILIVTIFIMSTVYLADDAIPGDLLYPLDRLSESVRYTMAIGSKNEAVYRVAKLKERYTELEVIRWDRQLKRMYRGNEELSLRDLDISIIEAQVALDEYQKNYDSSNNEQARLLRDLDQDITTVKENIKKRIDNDGQGLDLDLLQELFEPREWFIEGIDDSGTIDNYLSQ